MKSRNFVFIGIIFVIIFAVFLIFITLPPKVSTSGPSAQLSSPTVDATDHLSGGHLDGQLIFGRAGFLWAWRGNEATRLAIYGGKSVVAGDSVQLLQGVWSPTQNQIAYIEQDESFSDLWVVNASGTNPHNLTNDRGTGVPRSPDFTGNALWAYWPTWSPDGNQIAYLSDIRTDDLALWVVSAKGGQARKISAVGSGQGGIIGASWSPTGSEIAIAAFDNGKSQIYTVNPTTGKETELTSTPDGAYDPVFSPDGKYIAYTQRKGNGSELWLVSAGGGGPIFLAPGPTRDPAWSPDGTKIVYLALKGPGFELFEIGVSTKGQVGPQGSPQQISNNAQIDASGGLSWGR